MQELNERRYRSTPIPQNITKNTSISGLVKELETCSVTIKNLAQLIAACSSPGCSAHLADSQSWLEVRRMQVSYRLSALLTHGLPALPLDNPAPPPCTACGAKEHTALSSACPRHKEHRNPPTCGACGATGHTARSLACPRNKAAAPKPTPWKCGSCGRQGHTSRSHECPNKKWPEPEPRPLARRQKRKADELMLKEAEQIKKQPVSNAAKRRPSAYDIRRTDYRKIGAAQTLSDLATK